MTVPKLRFPEFRDAGEWEEKKLGELSQIVRGGSPRPIEDFLTTDIDGLNWLKIGDVDKNSKYVTNTQERIRPDALNKTREVHPGDLILSNSMSFGRPYILKIRSCIHDGWIAITEINKQIDRDYLYYLITSSTSQAYFLNNAAGSGVQNLNADIIKLLPILFPQKSEQQKIADCLSSIDDRITAETQKLNTLKAHKKGLMQQLFPAEGETIPKLRFPEFRDAGEWEEKKLGDMAEKISDGIHSTPTYNETGQYYFINGNNLAENKIVINGFTKRIDEIEYLKYKTELSSQTILISINGTVGNLAFFNNEKVVLGKSACYINLKPNENKYFVFNLLKTSNIQKYFKKELTGSTIKNLSLASIKNAKAFFPIFTEQQKIADCLSSLDDLITAQTQKIDALKLHKKGLMQQLFPSVEEVKG
jgi:type I restriction enzyme S subunit